MTRLFFPGLICLLLLGCLGCPTDKSETTEESESIPVMPAHDDDPSASDDEAPASDERDEKVRSPTEAEEESTRGAKAKPKPPPDPSAGAGAGAPDYRSSGSDAGKNARPVKRDGVEAHSLPVTAD